MSDRYKKAGVDIDVGNNFVRTIAPLIKKTHQPGVLSDLGGFGAHFALDTSEMRKPVLVSGTDGVGTKLKLAIETGSYKSIGIDLVAMCVNDIACSGAKPLFFLDYLATAKLDPKLHVDVIAGIADGCKEAKCALVGGETAEMPGFYSEGDFDLAGFAVGIVDGEKIIDGSSIGANNSIVGIGSSGPHSNGYSLIRRIIRDRSLDLNKTYEGLGAPLGKLLLTPTIIYSNLIGHLCRTFEIKGIAHITGGGFTDNIPRILPKSVQAVIHKGRWEMPPIFRFLQSQGEIDDEEMLRVFNCGIGMVLVIPTEDVDEVLQAVAKHGLSAVPIGNTRMRPDDGPRILIE